MCKFKRVFIFLIIPLLTFSCAFTKRTKTTTGPTKFSFEQPILSKEIDRNSTEGIPIDPYDTFTVEDPEVIASLKLRNLSEMHTLRWDWYDPDGNLYYTPGNYPIITPDQRYIKEVTF